MVYEWEPHKDVCYNLYIRERRSLEEIMQHMREAYQFTPSKRAFQTQFKRWEFPSKQNPAHRNVDLVTRVRELWEQNYSQRDMLAKLSEEGFGIKERELMRVRAKNRWLLRIPNGMKTPRKVADLDSLVAFEEDFAELASDAQSFNNFAKPDIPQEVAQKRKERHDQLKVDSEERWVAKKRRRRTRSYAGMPADPPGPPRFPSETTLEEGKQYLALDKVLYQQVRDDFQGICEDEGVIKKTLAGTDKWQAVKDRLISESEHLQKMFWQDPMNLPAKALALDVICTDVTKRMRTMERRMTIVEAKNALGLNPEQSRQIRHAFYTTLQADHFTSKLETGNDHWQELKDRWISKSPLLRKILDHDADGPDRASKLKALEILCRDVMKRLRDDQAKESSALASNEDARTVPLVDSMSDAQVHPLTTNAIHVTNNLLFDDISSLQIDPTLLETTNGFLHPPGTTPTAVYVRAHPKSTAYASAKMWLGSLPSQTVFELQHLVATKWPSATIARIDGFEKDTNGQDVSYLIEEDEELEAYLDHVQGRKAVFVVLLNRR